MIRFSIKPVSDLSARDIAETMRFLDACPAASAYQYPYAGGAGDVFYQMEKDGELCFSARGSSGYALSRLLPFMKVLVCNHGPVAGSDEDMLDGLEHLLAWARAKHYLKVKVMPRHEHGQSRLLVDRMRAKSWSFDEASKRFTLRMDIARATAAIFDGFPKACRYRIRRAGRENIKIISGNAPEQLALFVDLYLAMTSRKGIAQTSPEFFRALWELHTTDPTRICLLLAMHADKALGANIIFRTGTRAEYLFGAVDRSSPVLHGDVSAGHPLQWEAMQWAKSVGCTEYDFGGFDPASRTGPALMKSSFFDAPSPVACMPVATLDLHPALSFISDQVRLLANAGFKRG